MKPKTAAELLSDLQKDPKYLARQEAERADREAIEARLQDEQRVLTRELKDVGVTVSTVWDLVNSGDDYPKAIPVLVRHLKIPYDAKIREGIARALTVAEAVPFESELLAVFESEPDDGETGVKWALANAIAFIVTDENVDRVINIVADPIHGASRSILLPVLAASDTDMAKKTLQCLADDPQVGDTANQLLAAER